MKLQNAIIAWSPRVSIRPTAGMMKIKENRDGQIPYWTWKFDCCEGAVSMEWRKLRGREGLQLLIYEIKGVIEYHDLNPRVVHDACMEIDEYAEAPKFHIYKYRESVD
jgi:hypothetical protein